MDRRDSYYGPGRKGRSAGNRDDQSCERSRDRSLATRGPGPVIFFNTACVYSLSGSRAKTSLPVPILHEMPHVMLELGPGEEGGPPMPQYWNDGGLLCCSEYNAL